MKPQIVDSAIRRSSQGQKMNPKRRVAGETLGATVAVLMFALGAVSCAASAAPAAPHRNVRYHDPVFTTVDVRHDVSYGSAVDVAGDDIPLGLDLYQPTGDVAAQRPVLIVAHGGGFVSGNKDADSMVTLARAFAQRGYVTASINYRLDPRVSLACFRGDITARCRNAALAAQHDAQAAVRWFRANSTTLRVDPGRIAVGGLSAGAVAALGVAYNAGDAGSSGNAGPASDVQAAVSISGFALDDSWIGAGDAPALLLHGTADWFVPYAEAVQTRDAAHTAGLVASLVTVDGGGHGLIGNDALVIRTTADFLAEQFRLPPATP
jgi:acetyl esterase/lipase